MISDENEQLQLQQQITRTEEYNKSLKKFLDVYGVALLIPTKKIKVEKK